MLGEIINQWLLQMLITRRVFFPLFSSRWTKVKPNLRKRKKPKLAKG